MFPASITPLILTFNESANIGRTLERLSWAREIVVIDSFSTDDTVAIAREFSSVRLMQRKFDTHASQWNYGLAQVRSDWVLSLDADYLLPEDFLSELQSLAPDPTTSGFDASFKYCIAGRPLRATLYPPRTVLFRKDRASYYDEGHTQKLKVDGAIGRLTGIIHHDDRKPFRRWFAEQKKYMVKESRHLLNVPKDRLRTQDRIRRWIVVAPPLVFVYTLVAKGLVFDGWPGWVYVGQRTLAELLLSLRLVEVRVFGAD